MQTHRSRLSQLREALEEIKAKSDESPYAGAKKRDVLAVIMNSEQCASVLATLAKQEAVILDLTKGQGVWRITDKGRGILDKLNALQRDLGGL